MIYAKIIIRALNCCIQFNKYNIKSSNIHEKLNYFIITSIYVTVASGSVVVKEIVMIVMFAVTTVPCCRQDQHSAVFIWFVGTPIG